MRLHRYSLAVLAAAAWLSGGFVTRAAADGRIINALNPCCPPCVKHSYEGPPKLKFCPCCPKPICPCGSLEHFGYYQTCWAPWPYPPYFGHCHVPPAAAMIPPHPGKPPVVPQTHESLPNLEEQPPAPRQFPKTTRNDAAFSQ